MPLTIELPSVEGQTAFNVGRWREVLADPFLAKLPHRIETDRHSRIVMSPPPAFSYGRRQAEIAGLMLKLIPGGQAVTECPLSMSERGEGFRWRPGSRWMLRAFAPALLKRLPNIPPTYRPRIWLSGQSQDPHLQDSCPSAIG
jgi:hypothetical protein